MTIKLVIEKAAPTAPDKPVADVMISIHSTGELYDLNLSEATGLYQYDAEALCDVLHSALPGGTFAWLLAFMLERRASHFRVSFGHLVEKGD